MPCEHVAQQSGGARYLPDTGQLQFVLVCDVCGAERAQLGTMPYRPHPRRLVVDMAELIARELRLNEQRTARVRFAALVCGIGREQIAPEILNKQGQLTPKEWAEVRRQPELAAALLSDVTFEDIRDWILCHRERPDGRGYPRGLRGPQIPLEARILAVADAYTAMLAERPHRPARTERDARLELMRCAGTQFDGAVVRALLHGLERRDLQPAGLAA